MAYGFDSLEKRMKDNIRNYNLDHLLSVADLNEYMKQIAKNTNTQLLLTGRHGDKNIAIGNWGDYSPDVVREPGRKIRVANRTIGHLYIHYPSEADKTQLKSFFEQFSCQLEEMANLRYQREESFIFIEEMEDKLLKERFKVQHAPKEDALTGVYHHVYFNNRMQVIDRSETVPVAVIVGNINDWRKVNDQYGDEESDRLIQMVARILKDSAKPEYVIGRVDGDVFHILISMAEEEEAATYCQRVKDKCKEVKDSKFIPSIAMGYVYKWNIEQRIEDLISDAEYEMFQDKLDMKSSI